MLSNQTVQRLADSLANEVAAGIFESEEWVTLLHDLVPDIISSKLGSVDDDLLFDLSLCVMDKIVPTVSKV